MSDSVVYCFYDETVPVGANSVIKHDIKINGCANVAQLKVYSSEGSNVTLKGACTPVSDEDLALLEKNTVFQLHMTNGFIKIEKKEKEIDKVVSDMKAADLAAPVTPDEQEKILKEYEERGRKKIK